jgi:DNA replication protein DnaC
MAKERVVYQERKEDPEIILAKKIEEAGIPKNYRDSSFESYSIGSYSDPRSEVKRECQQFLQTDKKNLVILGTTGVGKTHLASAMIRESLKRGKSAKYIKEGALLRLIKSTFGQKGKTEQTIIDEFAAYDLLVIDEIGLSPWSEYNSQAITDIIDDRSNNGGKTVYLGNLDAETFKQHFNDQCLSRINSRKIILGLNTADYRRGL